MNPQTPASAPFTPSAVEGVTMFLKPSFMMTAQSSGLQVSVTVQGPKRPN